MIIDRGGGNGDGGGEPDPDATRRCRPRERPTASEQIEELLGYPWPFTGRPPRYDLATWTVTDDWPDRVPVTQDEIEVFERWFGDLFDAMLEPDS